MPDRVVAWPAVNARRLRRHGLAAPTVDSPAEVVRAICGAHAQIPSAAELSIGIRTVTLGRSDVRAALWDRRELVRTFGPRGTVHLLPTADLPMWTGALGDIPYRSQFAAGVRMTDDQVESVVAAVAEALSDAELTVDELDRAVGERLGPWATELVMPAFDGFWPRWRQVTSLAARRGVLCFGPDRQRRVTYTGPGRWLPGFRPMPPVEATARLLRDYLWAYGPATPQQFARWIGGPPAWAADVFGRVDLEPVSLEGDRCWQLPGDPVGDAMPEGVRLLPYFDAYAVGSHPRGLLFPGPAAERALAGSQAGNFPVLLLDGTVGGVWHARRTGRRTTVTVEPLRPLSDRHRRELDQQVQRLDEIDGGASTLTVGPVTVGPHA